MQTFTEKLEEGWKDKKFVCIGLDPTLNKLPKHLKGDFFVFNREIIDATSDLVLAYKPNSAFYEALGDKGLQYLKKTVDYIKKNHPRIPVILDAKRADIGSTNEGYVAYAFDYLGVDAITVHPYLGKEALSPFLARIDKGIIVLAKTSNPGAGEFQDLKMGGEPFYLHVAKEVSNKWNKNKNCALVVGATYPLELSNVRKVVGNMPILIPGIGAQGGDLEATLQASLTKDRKGIIISSSRSIIFASGGVDFAKSARIETEKLHNDIQKILTKTALTKFQKLLADELLKIGAVKFGEFRLKLHEEHPKAPLSPIYIDLRILRRFPVAKKAALDVYQELLKKVKYDLLADVPTAGTPFTSSLSDRVKKGMITPRTDKKTHGSGAKIDGMVKEDKGKRVVLIDDLITTSKSKLEAIEILRGAGAKVTDVVVLVDREQGGMAQLKEKKVNLHFALTLNTLLDYYLNKKRLTRQQFDDIHQRVKAINDYLKSAN